MRARHDRRLQELRAHLARQKAAVTACRRDGVDAAAAIAQLALLAGTLNGLELRIQLLRQYQGGAVVPRAGETFR